MCDGSFVGEEIIDVVTDGNGNYFYQNFALLGQFLSSASYLWEIGLDVTTASKSY